MQKIRALRQANGWSQYELALKLGVHPQVIYLWEHGRRTPQVPHMRNLGKIFGLCSDTIELEIAGAADTGQRDDAAPGPRVTNDTPGSLRTNEPR